MLAVKVWGVLILALVSLGVTAASLYQVDQREYALQMRFGKVQAIRMEPGLYARMPLVDSAQRIDRRTLRADIPPGRSRTRIKNA